MVLVDRNRLKGNYAQTLASAWLSRICLVRPVAEGTDIGVDLYCESVVDSVPYLHFWVQVKAIPRASIRVKGGDRIARYSFDRKHLEYWDRQPIPVYALLVPVDAWPPIEPDEIYVVRVTEELVKSGLPTANSTTYHTKSGFERDSLDDELRKFVTDIVPWDTSALLLRRGIVAPLAGQPGRFTAGVGFQYLPKMLASIRDASVQGLFHTLLGEGVKDQVQTFDPTHSSSLPPWVHEPLRSKNSLRKRFEVISETFRDEMHQFGLSALARSAKADGEIEKAKAYMHTARKRTESDPTLKKSERARRLQEIQELLAEFEER